jgi:phosphatidylinositol alpha-mannosyltransferase
VARLSTHLDEGPGRDRLRVALVCPYAWDRYGGVQSHVKSLAARLRQRGHLVRVLAPAARRPQVRALRRNGAVIVGRSVPIPANGSMAPVAFGPGAGAATRAALRAFRPDILHLHEPLVPSVSLMALLNTAVPVVGTFHAAAQRSFGYGASRPFLDRAIRRLSVRTAVSEAARDLVARYFPGDYVLTPNGVDVARFAHAEPLDWGPGRKVLFVGRLERRKGLEVLVEAMAALHDLDATLIVAGDGPEAPFARLLARRLRVRVRWTGPPSDRDLPRAFRSADVYCAPNLGGESFGVVLLEAMAAGTPVVCSSLPAFRAVAGTAAALVAPGDVRQLGAVLRHTLSDEVVAKSMRAAGRARAGAFDWGGLVGRVERIYRQGLAAGVPARGG